MRHQFLRAAVAGAVGGGGYDTDAQAWFTAVEAADADTLEVGVKDTVDEFITGCKTDGNWSAIYQLLIRRGPRTLDGALVQAKGGYTVTTTATAPQYERVKGSFLASLVNDIYIDTGLAVNALPQNNHHVAWFLSTRSAGDNNTAILGTAVGSNGNISASSRGTANDSIYRNLNFNTNGIATGPGSERFHCMNRTQSADYTILSSTTDQVVDRASATPVSAAIWLHQVNGGTANAALWGQTFWSAGEALPFPLLYRDRVVTLMADLTAALP